MASPPAAAIRSRSPIRYFPATRSAASRPTLAHRSEYKTRQSTLTGLGCKAMERSDCRTRIFPSILQAFPDRPLRSETTRSMATARPALLQPLAQPLPNTHSNDGDVAESAIPFEEAPPLKIRDSSTRKGLCLRRNLSAYRRKNMRRIVLPIKIAVLVAPFF